MTNTRCKICGNPRYNNNWKIIQKSTGYDLYCNNIECQKYYLIDFADHFLEKSKKEESKEEISLNFENEKERQQFRADVAAEELKQRFIDDWQPSDSSNSIHNQNFRHELGKLLDEYAQQVSRETAIDFYISHVNNPANRIYISKEFDNWIKNQQ